MQNLTRLRQPFIWEPLHPVGKPDLKLGSTIDTNTTIMTYFKVMDNVKHNNDVSKQVLFLRKYRAYEFKG